MTGPGNVIGPQPNKDQTPEDKYLVWCPQTITLLTDPENRFPDITPTGTVMNYSEMKAAKESAKESWMVLKTKKIEKGGEN